MKLFNRKRKPTKFSIALRRFLLASIPHFYDLPAGARFPYSGSSNAIEFRIDDEGKMGKLFLLDFYSRRVEATSWVCRVSVVLLSSSAEIWRQDRWDMETSSHA